MTSVPSIQESEQYKFYNYCVCFIDLLGQQEALRGHSILQAHTQEDFINLAKPIISPIIALQNRTTQMVQSYVKTRTNSPLRADLPQELQPEWDELLKTHLSTQYWSDGLVAFVSLGDENVKCPMNGVFGAFAMAGSEMLLSLSSRTPIRGGIEIAWGIELKPGELYGAAIARAYELESKFAQYPRIVIGAQTVDYLTAHLSTTEQDNISKYNRNLAQICLDMIIKDVDGLYILHYLGDSFRANITQENHRDLHDEARIFVEGQYNIFRTAANSKLAFRYRQLLDYFDHFAPRT